MEAHLERLLKNYCNVRQNYEAWSFMVNAGLKVPQLETAKRIRDNKLLSHLCYLAIKDFYFEFYTLLKESNDNKDSIFALLKTLIHKNDSKKKEAELNIAELEKNKVTIIQLCNLRDRYVSYLNKDHDSYRLSGISDNDIMKVFTAVEKSIVTLTSLESLLIYLDEIPSRDEFKL